MVHNVFHKIHPLCTATLLVWLCGFVSFALAEKMESSIQEALYLFELKGEISEAIKILENAANQGDEEDKEKAYFYLGKIQDLSGNKTSANFYYNQSLNRTTETSKAYWLSEREAATSNSAETFVRSPLPLKSTITKTFGNNPTYLLFQDGTIKKIVDDRLVNVASNLPADIQIFNVDPHGIWYQSAEKDSLIFQSFFANKPNKSYPIKNITQMFVQGEKVAVQTEREFFLLNGDGISTTIADKYSGCTPESFYPLTNEFILNCTDNALHFVSSEDGSEKRTLAQFDVIKNILVDKGYIYLISGNFLYCYFPKQRLSALWKMPVNKVDNIVPFENTIALLEASGMLTLIDKKSGYPLVAVHSDASAIYPLALGTLGLFSSEGAITAVDTALVPLWHFNFAKPIERAPIYTNGNIYLDFGLNKLTALSSRYYGKKKLQSEILAHKAADYAENEDWDELLPILDSLFKLEPGNAEGWFFKALYLEKQKKSDREKQKAWSEAVRLSISNPQVTSLILSRYAKAIGARFVSQLPISPKTLYPQFFSGKKYLYTIDPSAARLICINAENGDLRWYKKIGTLDNSPAIDNDENTLAIASGYNLTIFDLNREGNPFNLQLPGKAFETKVTESAIYVSTWNGFLLKILRPENKLAWSRKIFSVPFLLAKESKALFVCNLEGELVALDDEAGQVKENSTRKFPGQVTQMVNSDSIVAVASGGNKLYLFNQLRKEAPPLQILMDESISSLQTVQDQGKKMIMVGLADQSILLYTETGTPLWKYKSRNSIFPKPFVKDGLAWIDQGNEVVAISLKTGKVERKFSTPGGAGTPFIMNKTLFSASPKRLLYGFSL